MLAIKYSTVLLKTIKMNSKIVIAFIVSMVYLISSVNSMVCTDDSCVGVKIDCPVIPQCGPPNGRLVPPNPRQCDCCSHCVTLLREFHLSLCVNN